MNLRALSLLIAFSIAPTNLVFGAEKSVVVGDFSKSSSVGWENKVFKGETKYSFVYDPTTKTTVLQAVSNAAASGRYRQLRVDLTKTPFLNWSWKVLDGLSGIDENSKAGDDFSARIYVVVDRGIMSSLSVNYVWASMHPTESAWTSPYTKRVKLLAVDTGKKGLSSWKHYKRNVQSDLGTLFGENVSFIDAIALMTDTDNSGGHARTFYGDIWFSSQ
jgi:hypothetical protein